MKKILITATKALLYFVGWTLLVSFIPVPDFENPAIWRFAAELIPFLCIIGISILFWLIEKRSVKIFSLFNPIRNCLIGIVSGIAWLGLSFCIMSLSGVLKITQVNLVSMLWLWILSAFINTIMQELLVRGYLYQMIKTKYVRNLLGGLYRENPVKSRNYEAVKSSKKWENVGNSYIIPALLLYRYSYI